MPFGRGGGALMERLRIEQVILVEGKYDAAKLTAFVDALILTTDGFGIYRNRELQALLRTLGRQQGILLLTDPDAAGFRIRHFVTNLVGAEHVLQAYVPALPGKEPRKEQPGKEGLLGVEGVPADVLYKALLDAGAEPRAPRAGRAITYTDLYEWGLSGGAGSAGRRRALLKRAGLPPRLSKKALCELLGRLYTYEEFAALARQTAAEE